MALPMSLAYGLSKISSYSTNYYRIEVANQTQAENNSVITVNLPINALCNFKSISMVNINLHFIRCNLSQRNKSFLVTLSNYFDDIFLKKNI